MTTAAEFRHRASFEADRYGADPWVFVRELVQNSRDAGASRIELEAERRAGLDRIVCRDDGCGMSFEHARRYLFTLYASSKAEAADVAGRFGIGFWSVLRFGPDRIVVRSAPVDAPAWELRLSGDLESSELSETTLARGTEVELTRRASGDDPAPAVWNAVRRDVRYLRRRGADDTLLEVTVNSRPATTELDLPPPSLGFSRPGLRGAVALGEIPRVDLLAHGLRVRSAVTLDELLTEPRQRRRRDPALPEGLVPRLVLDSRRLRVLMARGDARTDRELRRLVALGRRGLRRLVRGELDREAGLDRIGRAVMRVREAAGARPARWLAAVFGAIVLTAATVFFVPGERPTGGVVAAPGAPATASNDPVAVLAGDLAERYAGPVSESPVGSPVDVALRYAPPSADPMLVVFRVTGVDDRGRALGPADAGPTSSYVGVRCEHGCVDIELEVAALPGVVRLPVPTGHELDPRSLRLESGRAELRAAPDGCPLLVLDQAYRGVIRYRTGVAHPIGRRRDGPWPVLPSAAAAFADGLGGLDPSSSARRAADWVRSRVAYETSAAVVERSREAEASGLGFVDRCLAVGAGDCDVQSTLVVAVLDRAGVPARVAVGWVGSGGRALPGLHAWVEFLGADGLWHAEDVSAGAATPPLEPPGVGSDIPVARRAGATPAPVRASAGRELPSNATMLVVGVVLAGLLAAVATVLRRRGLRHRYRPGGRRDLAGLVRGALARPEVYGDVPALFQRPVVPLLDRPPLSLRRARELAGRGRLAVSLAGGELCRRAVSAGCRVVDGGRPEGEAVATVLGAVDLDRWQRLLESGRRPPAARRVEEAAAAAGERWLVLVAAGVAGGVAALEGRLAGRRRGERVIAVDEASGAWRAAERLGRTRPAAAALVLAEVVVGAVRCPPHVRRELLVRLARGAVSERLGAGS